MDQIKKPQHQVNHDNNLPNVAIDLEAQLPTSIVIDQFDECPINSDETQIVDDRKDDSRSMSLIEVEEGQPSVPSDDTNLESLQITPPAPDNHHQSHNEQPNHEVPEVICRICHDVEVTKSDLLTPCACKGSLRYVHKTCFKAWIESSGEHHCGVCRVKYPLVYKYRPLRQYRCLPMTIWERLFLWITLFLILIVGYGYFYSLYGLFNALNAWWYLGSLNWGMFLLTLFGVITNACAFELMRMYLLNMLKSWIRYNQLVIVGIRQPKIEQSKMDSSNVICESNV